MKCRQTMILLALLLVLLGWSVFVLTRLAAHVQEKAPDAAPSSKGERRSDGLGATTAARATGAGDDSKPDAAKKKQRVQSSMLPPPPPALPLGLPRSCHALPKTELPGDVVKWGADHKQPTAAKCCDACSATPRCNTWVWCGNASACGANFEECWLKTRPEPYEDVDLMLSRSNKWSSGVVGVEPPGKGASSSSSSSSSSSNGGDDEKYDFALLSVDGLIRMRLRPAAPHAAKYVADLLDELRKSFSSKEQQDPFARPVPEPDPQRPTRDGLRFYRAEPVPAHWASPDWPDNYMGGRWGPPYALLQGSLRPRSTRISPPLADSGQGAKPIIRRGMVAWAGGRGGPDFFVALAQHPEWGNGHTVWAEVVPSDMAVIDAIMKRPLVVKNWGSINATELVTPMPYLLLTPEEAAARRRKKR